MKPLPETLTERSSSASYLLLVRSSVPDDSTSLNGSPFSYRLCDATLCGEQRSSGSGARTTKWSLRSHANMLSPDLRLTTHAAPHSMILAMCHDRPFGTPLIIGISAK